MSRSVAVVIPAFNARAYIGEALDSVAQQHRKAEQIIVVDDGSTDGTADVVSQWSNQNGQAVELVRRSNGGAATARNVAIHHARTDLIALLDADDLWLPHHLTTLVRGFEQQSDVVLCFGDAEIFDATRILRESYLRSSQIGLMAFDEQDGIRVIRQSPFAAMVYNTGIATCAQLVSRDAAMAIGLFDEAMSPSEDLDFPLRLSRIGKFAYSTEKVGRMRRHSQNTSHRRNRLRHLGVKLKVLEKMLRLKTELQLSTDEVAATQQAVRRTVDRMLYIASNRGYGTFCTQLGELWRGGYTSPRRCIKHCLRAALHPFGIAEQEQGA